MLALVVLIPLAIMIAACLLERFEARSVNAHDVAADPPARGPRADLRTPVAPPRLRVVPDVPSIGLDTSDTDLRQAS